MPVTSLRQLAQKIGVSHATVSDALRDCPWVAPATKARILKVAAETGYRPNPLASALMSEMRRSKAGTFRGVLAVLDMDGEENRRPGSLRYHRELARGAQERATALGFKADIFIGRQPNLSLKRIDQILQARGIRGIFLLPVLKAPDLTRLDWTHFSGIYADYLIEHPNLHNIHPNHYRAMLTALDRLRTLGYRRPGLVLEAEHDARLLHRWEASYRAYQVRHDGMTRLPPLITRGLNVKDFTRWFQSVKCDVVLAHSPEVRDWMIQAGAKVPETHGFCCLNVINSTKPCAGLDLQPHLLGERGMELLIGQVLRNECGVPDMPIATTAPAVWVDGPTVKLNMRTSSPRARAAAKKRKSGRR